MTSPMQAVRRLVQGELRSRVAGPDANAAHAAIWDAPGPRAVGPEDPIWKVHGDASMFVGGLRALLLQSLHPIAMQGVAEHSDYRHDPWGRLQRTAAFLATTTFGTTASAQTAVAQVHAVHRHVTGTTPDGQAYEANDPHLLGWVHVAEIDSFLVAFERYGSTRLTPAQHDTYIEQAAVTAAALGVVDPPRSRAELHATIDRYRPELRATGHARDAARFLLLSPPLPLIARAPYALLAGGAVDLLPRWARRSLWLPPALLLAPLTRSACSAAVATVRWAMTDDAAADTR